MPQEFHQEQQARLSPLLRRIQTMDQKQQALREPRANVADTVVRGIRERLKQYNGSLKIAIHDDEMIFEEFAMLATEECLMKHAEDFDKIGKNPSLKRHIEQINTIVERYAVHMHNLLSGATEMRCVTAASGELDRRYSELLEEGSRVRHFGWLLKMGQVQFRDFDDGNIYNRNNRATKNDIELFAHLYNKNKIDGEDLANFAAGRDSPHTLLAQPERHEIPEMERLLEVTRYLKDKKTVAERRGQETMYGRIAYGPLGPEDVLGVVVHTLSPMDPEKDPIYKKNNESFLEGGISGGKLNVNPETWQQMRDLRLRAGGRSQDLFFIMGAAPGISKFTLADGVINLKDLQSGSQFYTYTLGGVVMQVNGKPAPGIGSSAQNLKCLRLLNEAKYRLSNASDQNEEQPFEEYTVQNIRLGARPIWTHLQSDKNSIQEWAGTIR